MPKKVLAVDFDDVVHDFNTHFIQWHHTHFGSQVTYETAYTFNLPELYGCSTDEIHKRVYRYSEERGLAKPPIEGSVRSLKHLSLRYELHIVTSRLETNHDPVVEWTSEHVPGVFSGFHFTNGFGGGHRRKRGKSEVCLDIGAVALIDDSYEHASETVAGADIPVLMPNRPWNRLAQFHPMILRMDSWDDITSLLLERA